MAETGKGRKKALVDALMAEKGQRTLTPEDIQSKNVELNSSLKNWVVILDHDIDDPIMSIHTTAPPETAPPE
jgi:hypothetical protein